MTGFSHIQFLFMYNFERFLFRKIKRKIDMKVDFGMIK